MFPIVRVVWTDAMAINEWKTLEELKKDEGEDKAPCVSVGFLVKKTREFYYVANTITSGAKTIDDILMNAIMMIPRKWVKSIEEINIDGTS